MALIDTTDIKFLPYQPESARLPISDPDNLFRERNYCGSFIWLERMAPYDVYSVKRRMDREIVPSYEPAVISRLYSDKGLKRLLNSTIFPFIQEAAIKIFDLWSKSSCLLPIRRFPL